MSQNQHDAANNGSTAPKTPTALVPSKRTTPPTPAGIAGSGQGTHGGSGIPLARDAKGSSHRGDEANAESENTSGGSDKAHKNQPKNTTK